MIRSIMPSIMAAVPYTVPLCMLSSVLRPMMLRGFSMLMAGSCDALALSALSDVFTPGIIMPPMKQRSPSMTLIVVAVPMSMIMAGAP